MDEMKITSKFTTSIISKLVKVMVKKKTGFDIDIQLNGIRTTITEEGKTHVHLDVDAELNKDELGKILKEIGL